MSRAANITRRRLLAAGAAATAATQIPDALARPGIMRGGKARPVAGDTLITGMSLTMANTSASATPADLPLAPMMAFRRGDVPVGKIAVPVIGGADQVYQADQRTYWDDGSLCLAKFRIIRPIALAGSATIKVDFAVRSGSYDNTSSVTTADITGASDYNIAISNCHTATPTYVSDKAFAIRIGSGLIAGVKVNYPANMTVGTINVTGAGGAGGQISITAGTPTIVNPGSGYGFVGGTGAFSAAFNSIVSAVASGGNHVNGVSIEQYAKGPVCNAWEARTTIPGLNHFHVTFLIERWTRANGSFLAHRAMAVFGTGLVDTVNTLTNYTYDLDWRDGTTVIRGVSNGDTQFETMMNYGASTAMTFGLDARPDWSVNNVAYNAIIPQRTQAEVLYFRETGMILPWDTTPSTKTVPVTQSAYSTSANSAGTGEYGIYRPFGNAGIRSPLGGGGGGNQEDPMQELDGLYWLALYASNISAARTWHNNIRISCAHALSFAQHGSGIFEPTTMYVPNVIPAGTQSFPGMTPTRELVNIFSFPAIAATCHPLIGSGNFAVSSSIYDTYHQICTTYGAYLIEGEQWMQNAVLYSASSPMWGFNTKNIVGAATFYGISSGAQTNVRFAAWLSRSKGYAAAVMPDTWANGATNIQKTYILYTLQQQYKWYNTLIPHVGSTQRGASAPISKLYDYTGSGVFPELFGSAFPELAVPFMDDYDLQVAAHLAFIHQNPTAGSAGDEVLKYLTYRRNYFAGIYTEAANYFSDSYRLRVLDGPNGPPVSMANGFDTSNPGIASWTMSAPGSGGNFVKLATTNGSSTIQLYYINPNTGALVPFPIMLYGTTRLPNGSRLRFTTTDISNTGANSKTIPGGFDGATWYYWKEVSPLAGNPAGSAGELHRNAALTDPVTATSDVAAANVWMVPNSIPANNSGFGTYHGGTGNAGNARVAVKLGTLRAMKALDVSGLSQADLDNAISHTSTIFASIFGSFASEIQYNWAASRLAA